MFKFLNLAAILVLSLFFQVLSQVQTRGLEIFFSSAIFLNLNFTFLFLYWCILHFFVIHAACTINFFINGHTISQAGGTLFAFRPNDFGYDLWIVYLIWIVLVIGIYPLCKKYSRYKASHNYWWLSYV